MSQSRHKQVTFEGRSTGYKKRRRAIRSNFRLAKVLMLFREIWGRGSIKMFHSKAFSKIIKKKSIRLKRGDKINVMKSSDEQQVFQFFKSSTQNKV